AQKYILSHIYNSLEHFEFYKLYYAIYHKFYWPCMCTKLKEAYIFKCNACQRNKIFIIRPVGPLHLLSMPDKYRNSVAIDLIGPL
ncbi:hypothetical protein OBBRIDRAFT_710239, partial [Obba rivulosa]